MRWPSEDTTVSLNFVQVTAEPCSTTLSMFSLMSSLVISGRTPSWMSTTVSGGHSSATACSAWWRDCCPVEPPSTIHLTLEIS